MKNIFILIFTLFFLASCNFDGDEQEVPGGGLLTNHKTAVNVFELNVPTSKKYQESDFVDLVLVHSYDIEVTGNPRLAIDIDGSTKYADYLTGSGSPYITFRYLVQAGDEDLDGIGISTSIDLNGGGLSFTNNGVIESSTITFSAVDTSQLIIDTNAPNIDTLQPPVPATYLLNEQMQFMLIFSDAVEVTGIPRITIDIGGNTKYATYSTGSGTSTILFRYTVTESDIDLDGILMSPSLDLNSGTIKDLNGNSSTLILPAPLSPLIVITVNGGIPYVKEVISPISKTYLAGDLLTLNLKFTEDVTVTGSPRVAFNIDTDPKFLNYTSGSGTDTLTFEYSITPGDEDTNGVLLGNLIDLNSGTIEDTSSNSTELEMPSPLTPGVLVDAGLPTVISIDAPLPDTYFANQEMFFILEFDKTVDVVGTPRIPILLNSSNPASVYGEYISGTGTELLIFKYTVIAGNSDSDGIELQNTIDLSAGSIKATGNTMNADLDMTAAVALTNTTAILVDATPPAITGLTVPIDDSHMTNSTLNFIVNFSKIIDVTNTPRIPIDIGGVTKYADYIGGTGTSDLFFQYTIVGADLDSDGISFASNLIDLNTTGTIKDSFLVDSDLDFSAFIPSLVNVLVNFSAVTISSITPPANSTYIENDNLDFIVNAVELLNIVGSPRIQMDIGGTTKYADYIAGTGTTAITFRYIVEAGLDDLDGIEIVSPIDLNLGTIKSATLQNLNINFTPPAMPSVLVDTTAPLIAILDPVEAGPINTINDSVTFAISGTCDETAGAISIEVDSIAATSPIGFICNGTTFAGTIDTTALTEAGHTIVAKLSDTVSNEGVSTVINITKDLTIPTITSVTPPADQIYIAGASVDFIVNLDESTDITGTPRIQLDITGVTRYADYASGSGTSALTFSYTVIATDTDSNGITIVGTTIDPNLGSLEDSNKNPIDLNLDATIALPNLSLVLIDGIIPTVAITSSPDITSANKTTYSVSGTCSENSQTVSVNLGGIALTPSCSSNAWTTGTVDVSGLSDSAALPITADHSDTPGNNAVQASTTVDKNTFSPQVTITNSPDITSANLTAYSASGSCTQNGVIVDVFIGTINIQPNCAAGTWTTGLVDTTGLADNPTIALTANHSTATQASVNISKDTFSPVVTISSSPNITTANELSYVASGTCSENTVSVDINIGVLNYLKTCSGGSWTTGIVNVSSLVDSGSISFTVDHSTATQVSTTISKNTSTPTIASLSIPATLKDSADLSWVLTDPGGFTINDYDLNYRVKGTPTWLNFVDGVSVTTTHTITSLLASTTYEFRVRVNYDTTFYSGWSTTAEAETKPDDPLFNSPYVAMNVGGSTDTNVVAFYDNTRIYLNGTEIVGSPINKGAPFNIPGGTSQFDIIDADKPIYTAGRRGAGTNAHKDKMNVVWNPTSWAGKSFSFNSLRDNPQQLHVYAIENTTVTVKQGSTVLDTAVITAGTGSVLSWSLFGSYQVVSTGTILAFHSAGDPATSRYGTPKPLFPSSNEIIGFPSSSLVFTTEIDSTNYNAIHGDSNTASGSLNKIDLITIYPIAVPYFEYQGDPLLVTADQKITGASFNDGTGSGAAPFLPTSLMKKNHAINNSANWVAFASKLPGTIEVRDSSDSIIETLTLTRSGANSNAPYKARRAATPTGYRFFATVPVAAWYDPDNDVGSSANDETILYGTDE